MLYEDIDGLEEMLLDVGLNFLFIYFLSFLMFKNLVNLTSLTTFKDSFTRFSKWYALRRYWWVRGHAIRCRSNFLVWFIFCRFTAKTISDRWIIPSICHNLILYSLLIYMFCRTWNCFANSATQIQRQFHVHNAYKTRKSQKNG